MIEAGRSEQVFAVHNGSDRQLVLHLEPWAEDYLIPPRSSVDLVVGNARLDRVLEWVHEQDRAVVFAYAGSTVSVRRDGREVEPFTNALLDAPRQREPVPDLPEGMRTSEFFGLLGLKQEN